MRNKLKVKEVADFAEIATQNHAFDAGNVQKKTSGEVGVGGADLGQFG